MKYLLTTVVAASLFLFLVGICFAATNDQNELGLFYDRSDLTSVSHSDNVQSYETIHLILLNPYFNCSFIDNQYVVAVGTKPVTNIKGVEIRVEHPVGQTLFYSSPGGAMIIGQSPDYIIAFDDPIPVIDRQAYLGSFFVLGVQQTATNEYFLTPIGGYNPSISGHMACSSQLDDGTSRMHAAFPISGSHDAPVFVFNGAPVPTERETWSSVKALYR